MANFSHSDDQNEEGFGNFLDDFAINVFLPQIEEKVMQLIHLATSGKKKKKKNLGKLF